MTGSFDPLLLEFWSVTEPKVLEAYATRGGCGMAARDFHQFLENRGIMIAEVLSTGYLSGGKKKKGWFLADVPDTDIDAFTQEELLRMKYQGLNPKKRSDRLAYITDNGLEEEFRWIPHAWVEIRDRVLDPSGFLPDGNGQFDGLVKSRDGIQSRYQYFK